MLESVIDITPLLHGELPQEQACEILSQLQPEGADHVVFSTLLDQLKAAADARYDRLKAFGADCFDCCGTGGSGKPRFNTSTAVAFVLAAANIRVAKFGNRAASSKSGSFDVLERLGIGAELSPDAAEALLDRCQLAFLFAPQVYPALANLSAARRAFGKRTLLNFVGPLLNPVDPARRLLGVAEAGMMSIVADTLASCSSTKVACVVRSSCGLDEICPGCHTQAHIVGQLAAGFETERFGLAEAGGACGASDMEMPTADVNAAAMLRVFDGMDVGSEAYNLICANAAAALVLAGKAGESVSANEMVARLLSSGAVRNRLKQVVECYEKYAG